MRNNCLRSRTAGRRRGFQVLEAIFAVPVVVLMLLAGVSYGAASIVRSTLAHAAAVGAREAGKGADLSDVAAAVNTVLAANDMVIVDASGSGAQIVLQDGSGPILRYGDPDLDAPPLANIGSDEVCVILQVQARAKKIDGKRPIVPCLNVLGSFLLSDCLCVQSLVKKEAPRVVRVCNNQ